MADSQIGSVIAGGGVSSAIIATLYVLYKCCYRRKFHSKCCGASMDMDADQSSPTNEKPTVIEVHTTPRASPIIKAAEAPKLDLPQLDLGEHVRH